MKMNYKMMVILIGWVIALGGLLDKPVLADDKDKVVGV